MINISAQVEPLMHYNQTLALWGDVKATLVQLIDELRQRNGHKRAATSAWFAACSQKKQEWEAFKAERYRTPRLYDDMWKEEVLTQPVAIKTASTGPGRTKSSPSSTPATCRPTASRLWKTRCRAAPLPYGSTIVLMILGVLALYGGARWLLVLIPSAVVWYAAAGETFSRRRN